MGVTADCQHPVWGSHALIRPPRVGMGGSYVRRHPRSRCVVVCAPCVGDGDDVSLWVVEISRWVAADPELRERLSPPACSRIVAACPLYAHGHVSRPLTLRGGPTTPGGGATATVGGGLTTVGGGELRVTCAVCARVAQESSRVSARALCARRNARDDGVDSSARIRHVEVESDRPAGHRTSGPRSRRGEARTRHGHCAPRTRKARECLRAERVATASAAAHGVRERLKRGDCAGAADTPPRGHYSPRLGAKSSAPGG